jgi:hypothetical protein
MADQEQVVEIGEEPLMSSSRALLFWNRNRQDRTLRGFAEDQRVYGGGLIFQITKAAVNRMSEMRSS